MVDLNNVQVSVVRSNSAQRSIVDSVNVRSSLDGDSQHRRTSSFPENMAAGKGTKDCWKYILKEPKTYLNARQDVDQI